MRFLTAGCQLFQTNFLQQFRGLILPLRDRISLVGIVVGSFYSFLFSPSGCFSSNSRPVFVSRYFCLLLRGLSGIVISISPTSRCGRKMLLRNRVLFVCPAAFINIPVDMGLLAISSREIQMPLGTNLGPLSPVTGVLSGKNAQKTCSPYPRSTSGYSMPISWASWRRENHSEFLRRSR